MSEQSPQQQPPFEYKKFVYQDNLEKAHRAHDKHDEQIRYLDEHTIKAAQTAIQALILINGGAVLALLTFLGTLPDPNQKTLIADTLVWFASGVGSAVVAYGLAYLTHLWTVNFLNSHTKEYDHPYIKRGRNSQVHWWSARAFTFWHSSPQPGHLQFSS